MKALHQHSSMLADLVKDRIDDKKPRREGLTYHRQVARHRQR